jgi:hypothetical protein
MQDAPGELRRELRRAKQRDARQLESLKAAITAWRKDPLQKKTSKPAQRQTRGGKRVDPGAGSYQHPADLDYP